LGYIAGKTATPEFETIPFAGKWKKLIGNPSDNFKIMISGKTGSGKSTLAIQFANYLSKGLKLKVLYVAREEKLGYTLQEKFIRMNAANANLSIAFE